MKKPKILIVHPHLNVGGAEKMIAFVANSLSSRYEVHLVLIQDMETSLKISPEINVQTLGLNESEAIRSMGIGKAFGYTRKIKQQIASLHKDINADISLAFDDRVSLLTWWALRKTESTILFSQRADPYNKPKLWRKITRFLYRQSDGVVFQTEMAKKFYALSETKHTPIIPNPAIEHNSVLRNDQKYSLPPHHIVSAGRLQDRKGFDTLIKAFNIVNKQYPEYKLLVYGDGIERDKLLSLVNIYDLNHAIDFPGTVKNVMDMCKGAEMFVLPSRSEGIPNVLIEAMVNDLPCIATDCTPGGARLMLNNGKCGLIVPIDDVEKLADAIIAYIKSPELRSSNVEHANAWLKQFNEETIEQEWIKFVDFAFQGKVN